MSPLNLIRKEFLAALHEANRPFFQEESNNDYFYSELSNYYHSLQGKTIDTTQGESLFPAVLDNRSSIHGEQLPVIEAFNKKLSKAAEPSDFEVGQWEPV